MQSSSPSQRGCLIVVSWIVIVAGGLFASVSSNRVSSGRVGEMIPAPWAVDLAAFICAAVVVGAGLVSLAILHHQPLSRFGSWLAIVGSVVGLTVHSLGIFGADDPSRAHYHWAACIGYGVFFGAGLVSLAIIASKPRTSNDQVNHDN